MARPVDPAASAEGARQVTRPGRPASAKPTANGLSPSSVTRWTLRSVTLSPGGTVRATRSDGQPGIFPPDLPRT